MARSVIDPRDVGKLRVSYRTKREFLIERNVIQSHEYPSREQVRECIGRLVHSERNVLQRRLATRLERLDELMNGERKTFDEPAVEHSDLIAGVRLQREDARY